MGEEDTEEVFALGDCTIEQPRDLFIGAEKSLYIEKAVEPQFTREIGGVFFEKTIGGGRLEFIEFDKDFVAVFPRFNFTSSGPIRFADSRSSEAAVRFRGGRDFRAGATEQEFPPP